MCRYNEVGQAAMISYVIVQKNSKCIVFDVVSEYHAVTLPRMYSETVLTLPKSRLLFRISRLVLMFEHRYLCWNSFSGLMCWFK